MRRNVELSSPTLRPLITPAVLVLLVILFLPIACNLSRPQLEYVGNLEPELVADISSYYAIEMKPLTVEQKERFSAVISKKSTVFVGDLMPPLKDLNIQVLLVEPAQGARSLYFDLHRNGSWTSTEGFTFTTTTDNRHPGGSQVSFMLSLPDGFFYKSYPVVILRPQPVNESAVRRRGCTLSQSRGVCAQATIDINGQKRLVQYTNVDLQTGKIDPTNGWLGIDGNGDGRIDYGDFSPEYLNAFNEAVVFRVGGNYVSTESVDAVTRKVILKERSPSEYLIIEMRVGAQVPDFSFVDFEGKVRKLSDFKSKYLLLEFWGTWCPPCVAAVPSLKEAYLRYHSRGFEILGMDVEMPENNDQAEALKKAKTFTLEKGVTWPQATTESIKTLVERRFRIVPYPTSILLDQERRVVSFGQKSQLPLRGRELMDTLEKLLPVGSG